MSATLKFFLISSTAHSTVPNSKSINTYHTIGKLQSPLSLIDTHFICLFASLDDYATWYKLLPFCKLLNKTNQDMFIHGPFDFTTISSCKS